MRTASFSRFRQKNLVRILSAFWLKYVVFVVISASFFPFFGKKGNIATKTCSKRNVVPLFQDSYLRRICAGKALNCSAFVFFPCNGPKMQIGSTIFSPPLSSKKYPTLIFHFLISELFFPRHHIIRGPGEICMHLKCRGVRAKDNLPLDEFRSASVFPLTSQIIAGILVGRKSSPS